MTEHDATDWLDPAKEPSEAPNSTGSTPEYDAPPVSGKPKTKPLQHHPQHKAKHRK